MSNNNIKNVISSGSSSVIKETTNSFTKSSTRTTIASSSSSSPPPPPPPPAGRQNKPSIAGTKSNHIYTFPSTTTKITTNNQQQQQPIVCSLCSSHDVTEVNVKIKSCQNCSNVVVDEIACNSNASSASNTIVEAGSQSYYQHLAVITKKLKNLYKTKVHSVSNDTQEQQSQQQEPQFEMRKRSTNVVGQSQRPTFMKTRAAASNSLVTPDAVNKPDKSPSPDCDHHHQQQQRQQLHQQQQHQQHKHHDHHKCSSNSSSVSKAPLNKTSSDKNKKHNKDVLILRICDLDVKEKSEVIELSGKKSTSPIDCNISTSPCNHTTSTSTGKTIKLLHNDKKSIKSRGTQIESGTTKLIKNENSNIKPPPVRKIVVISEEYKKNSERNDFRIENRKEIIKKFKQNNAISKSLDVILPQSDWDLHNGIDNSPYVFTSKSVTNLNDIIIDDDDDGPFESINSVELIFISDEFLNKAIKHDLKILKGTKTPDTLNIIDNSTQSSSATSTTTQQQQQLPLHQQQQQIKKKSKKIIQKSPSPRSKESPSPISISERGTQSVSRTSCGGLNSSKKLIVISEDFKRKSLENNIVIVDDGGDNNETAIKRKNFKHLKLTRQQSSIDDVGNQMTSHAFCSFEEPDEQCLESKDIKASD